MAHRNRSRLAAWVVGATVVSLTASAGMALAGGKDAKSEHWGVIDRNTIGSPVAELREGPFSAMIPTGDLTAPPFGKGSLGIEVGSGQEKVAFGNETDFFGDPVLGLTDVGYRVFQTGENASTNASNLPNITFEIDPNVIGAGDYTSMVWVPDPDPFINQWSPYIDATLTGKWYFTGLAGSATGCNQATTCTFGDAKTALVTHNNGTPPSIYTAAISKGRDSQWQGAVDGLRINDKVYDFEPEPEGVKTRNAK